MKIPLLDLKAQYKQLRTEIHAVIDDVCDAQQFILGEKVRAFEEHLADYCGARYAIGVSSGSDALLVSLMALDIGPGEAVITTPFTFFATAGAIARLGATPLFVDIDPITFNINPADLKEILDHPPERFNDRKPKILLPVHLFGQCADMDAVMEIAAKYGCNVVEDAAQALGADYPSRNGTQKAGTMGQMGCFSFFPSKNLGGFGDGGMVVTNEPALADKLRALRNHGANAKYIYNIVGGNFRLDALQAAILDVKLKYLEEWNAARRAHAEFYNQAFRETAVRTPQSVYTRSGIANPHTYHQYVIRVSNRDDIRNELESAGVGCEVYYPLPLHLQECFANLGYKEGDFPESEKAAREVLALPIYPELTKNMLEHVVKVVLKAVRRHKKNL